ncbi:MAG TPA: ABC transporter ATP-binding protein [Trueperaceae bacterium]|nr:ABC transporter ATP-binding protein [Trueperaceae bacterium]
MSELYTKQLSLGYADGPVVEGLDLGIPEGRITALVGANGSGKSTILKALARVLQPRAGAAFLDGKEIHRLSTREVAKRLAILPQGPEAPEGLTVGDLVTYGRYPHRGTFGGPTSEDRRMCDWALSVTGMTVFAERQVGQLSGGQRQRAWIAMALAQGTEVLLLDEPTTFLDMAHQLEVLQLLERLNRDQGRTIVMVVHDLNHASRFAHHMVAIARGKVAAQGTPREVMTPDVFRKVFAIDADIVDDPRLGVPICIPQAVRPLDNTDIGL